MATQEEILAEPRLSEEQEMILYNIALRQDELGREPTNVLLSKIENDPKYQEMFDREFLTYQVYNHGGEGAPVVASLIVTLKGMRYCIAYGDEIEPRRPYDTAGNRRDNK
ncbi:MAG: hypothetical protein E7Z99_05940 [Coriobacteriaceae bacterium]|nr:hypothetical protein [Coriobacteriaceae bacterium]